VFDKKIKIRSANTSDTKDIFAWRSDPLSQSMFFDTSTPLIEDHTLWLESSLKNANRKLYIGEIGQDKIGVCRFDLVSTESYAEVSININPENRGLGLGRRFLEASVDRYLRDNQYDLLAKIKIENIASLRIFKAVGFETISCNSDVMTVKLKYNGLLFKEIVEEDSDVLFGLLKKRTHSISHQQLPSKNEHISFVRSHPYRYWALVCRANKPLGTIYLQTDNSIGLNLLEPSLIDVSTVLRYVHDNFAPLKEVKSKVPSYFFVNVPHENTLLKGILLQLGALPIQIAYKIEETF